MLYKQPYDDAIELFLQNQNEYLMDRRNEDTLVEMSTQSYMQSLRLTKRRLKKLGLTMETELASKYRPVSLFTLNQNFHEDGKSNHSVTREQVVKRIYYQNNCRISRKKNKETVNVTFHKGDIPEDQTFQCPNCAYQDKISRFMKACPACGGYFAIDDDRRRVSDFSMAEQEAVKIKSSLRDQLRRIFWFSALVILTFVFIMLHNGIHNHSEEQLYPDGKILFAYEFSITMVAIAILISIVLRFLYRIAVILVNTIFRNQIRGSYIVSPIAHFSPHIFLSNLEYKLRNIHMAENGEEVQPFASFKLSGIVRNYQAVADCDLTGLTFHNLRQDAKGYYLDSTAKIRCAELENGKIKTRYEKVKISFFGKRGVVDTASTKISECHCKNCGSSIHLLEAGICQYCDQPIQYEDYDWVITNYESDVVGLPIYRGLSAFVVILYLINYLGFFAYGSLSDGQSWKKTYQKYTAYDEFIINFKSDYMDTFSHNNREAKVTFGQKYSVDTLEDKNKIIDISVDSDYKEVYENYLLELGFHKDYIIPDSDTKSNVAYKLRKKAKNGYWYTITIEEDTLWNQKVQYNFYFEG